ncbi:uncharacterized protein Pyn_05911 [Prunus yedoensis var. nudiflora]|uniref:DUF241 domain protein n=1 Tax=Prunus yedoensis var. nudiflora TaxID=2094558 RepID=A0A314YA09_PRUYE|nr:uncharacterized protein Pyn_05911 [Prunus yedoensis var. nudiflora]
MAFHTRSNSFPSRPHPIVQEVEEHLCRLRSSEATSTSSSPSISHKLSGLQELHDCVDRLLQLPLTQQALAQEQNEKWANEILDGSLRLLDVCSSAKDVILQTKECVQDLQSIIRRRRGGETGGLTSEFEGNSKQIRFSSLNKDHEKLREVEAVTLAVFESLLSSISEPKSKTSSWSLVSKIMQSKKVACEEEAEANEFAQVDAALNSLIGHKTSKSHNQKR